jgi:CSLREA domain-containing protein
MALCPTLALPASQAFAATITVNTFTDELNADGDCSLREAVRAANTDRAVDACTAGGGADTINLQTGTYSLMIPGASEDAAATGDMDLLGTVTIAGSSTTVKTIPASGDRVLHVVVGATATISGVTVEGGLGSPGGGIYNEGTLTLNNSTVWLNNATFGGEYSTTGRSR